jgi:uncharacterized membrane protein YcaP (DUF421 family)
MNLNIFIPEVPLLEKIIRPLIVYIFLLIAFRIFGKRELGTLTPFDLIILLTIANVLQNAMIGADNSVTGGLIGASTMLLANWILARVTFRFPEIERIVEGEPTVLIQNGRILKGNLERELLTEDDLKVALRKNQVDLEQELSTIRRVELDPDGSVTITRNLSKSAGLIQRRRGKTRRED